MFGVLVEYVLNPKPTVHGHVVVLRIAALTRCMASYGYASLIETIHPAAAAKGGAKRSLPPASALLQRHLVQRDPPQTLPIRSGVDL